MAKRYNFTEEQIQEIVTARKKNKDKNASVRLKALELRAKGASGNEVSKATGFHSAYVSRLVSKYRKHGIGALCCSHYGGNHRNMTIEEETAILAPFHKRAEAGGIVTIKEIKEAYQAAVDHPISASQIYSVLHRHGWYKDILKDWHPPEAANAAKASKK